MCDVLQYSTKNLETLQVVIFYQDTTSYHSDIYVDIQKEFKRVGHLPESLGPCGYNFQAASFNSYPLGKEIPRAQHAVEHIVLQLICHVHHVFGGKVNNS